jgi:sigma-B regulation protein RsbU (phosphoserine phosphatase)
MDIATAQAAIAPAREDDRGPSQAPSILIVDDVPLNAVMLERILSREGFRTLLAGDGPEARSLAREHKPDVILLDVVMPGETGFETCALLQADIETADIPVLFVSALDSVADKVKGLRIGGVDFISKPFQPEEVLARVRVHLKIRAANRAVMETQRARLEELRHAQRSILVNPEELPEANFGVYFRPMEETGGDFYDAIQIDDRTFGYFVADVSGHGVGASFVTSAIKALIRQYSGPLFSPLDTMRSINSVLRTVMPEERYLTACWALWNRRGETLSVVSAGHPPLIVVRPGIGMEVVEMQGDPLGVFGSVVLQQRDVRLARGCRFFLYTDGLIEDPEVHGADRRPGIEKLSLQCEATRQLPISEAPRVIVEQLRPGPAGDDLLLLGVEVPR